MLVFITDRKRHFQALSKKLHQSGIYLLHSSTDTALFTCDKKDTGAVLLDCVPANRKCEGIAAALRQTYPDLPMAVIVERGSVTSMLCDRILYEDAPHLFFEDVLEFCTFCGFGTGRLSTPTVSIGARGEGALYLGYPLPLPPRALEVLRCLVYRYPHPTAQDDLMSLCFPGEALSISNLTVAIHAINCAAREISPMPLVVHLPREGYVLSPCE